MENIYLYKIDENVIVILPIFSEEFDTFQMIKIRKDGKINNLGLHTFSYNDAVKINYKFLDIKYFLIQKDNSIRIYSKTDSTGVMLSDLNFNVDIFEKITSQEKEEIKNLRQTTIINSSIKKPLNNSARFLKLNSYYKSVYEISKKIKLKKITSENQIIKCQLPPKFLTEENPYLSETFTFSLGKPELKYIDGLFKLDLVVEENFVRIIPPKNSNFYLPDSSARIYPHCFGDFNADKKQDVLVYLGACGTSGCSYGLFLNQIDNYYKLAFNDYLKSPEFKTEKNSSICNSIYLIYVFSCFFLTVARISLHKKY
jgi:hypothetical protein